MKLNPQQELAASHKTGPCLTTACPGSGKTAMLVERTGRLVESGISPSRIICLTFTNKAAKEMAERIRVRLGAQKLKMFVGTFHSLCVRVIRRYHSICGLPNDFTIMDSSDQESYIKRVAKQAGFDPRTDISVPLIAQAVNMAREELGGEEEIRKILYSKKLSEELVERNTQIGLSYLESIRLNGMVDFSGLLSTMNIMLRDSEEVRNSIQSSHDYLQVDEVQDTNLAQFNMVNVMSEKHNNVFMVGDLSQSIYGWRGSRCENITDFISNHPGCNVLELGQNYRSTPEIIAAADKLIKHNSSHMGTEFKTGNPSGKPIYCGQFMSPEDEAEFVASSVIGAIRAGVKPHNIAILYRLNSLSRVLEEEFRRKRIPYKVVGGFGFYERSEVKDCLAMLRLASNKDDIVAFDRVCSFIPGVGTAAVTKVEELSKNNPGIGLIAACDMAADMLKGSSVSGLRWINRTFTASKSMLTDVSTCLDHVLRDLRYVDMLRRSKHKNKEDKERNVQELSISMKGKVKQSVSEYIQQISLMSSGDEETEQDRATMMTLHASKGLEFPLIFMVGVEANILPHARAVEEREGGLEEERRLCYVGMTRAKSRLFMTYCKFRRSQNGGNDPCQPSEFLIESGLIKKKVIV
ncbi:MAG: ATP-dependent helicase [Candidatus Cloacimonetes bacterium]|nr:ATP-dependent helicase [Candidatus Cloacimonadota bacterium]